MRQITAFVPAAKATQTILAGLLVLSLTLALDKIAQAGIMRRFIHGKGTRRSAPILGAARATLLARLKCLMHPFHFSTAAAWKAARREGQHQPRRFIPESRAAPRPVFGLTHQFRFHGIALNVTDSLRLVHDVAHIGAQ